MQIEGTVVVCQICGNDIPLGAYEEHTYKAHGIGNEPRDNHIQLYSEHAKELKYTQQNKIKKFIEQRCIEYAGGNTWICKPIAGYNVTVYRITKNEFGEFQCTCQWNVKQGLTCAHIGALYEYLKRGGKYE